MALFSSKTREDQIKRLEGEIDKLKNKSPKDTSREKSKYTPKQVMYKWKAPIRIHIKRDRDWYMNISIWVLLIIVVMLFFAQYLLIFTTLALTATAFIIARVPPTETTHVITTKGIETFDKMYFWDELEEYWLIKKSGKYMMTISTRLRFPTALLLVVPKRYLKDIINNIDQYLPYKETRKEQGRVSKMTDGLFLSYEKVTSNSNENTLNPSD